MRVPRVVQEEAAALAERRVREKQRVTAVDSYDNPSGEDVSWYIISESWLAKWRSFVDNGTCLQDVCVRVCACVCVCVIVCVNVRSQVSLPRVRPSHGERAVSVRALCLLVCLWLCAAVGATDGSGRGVLPPGPISNHVLLKQNGEPIQNLKPGRVGHYRGINYKVWNVFVTIYGGGPLLRRKFLNIYDKTPCE